MWLFTTLGFFSIVRKNGDNELTIRSRTHGDLLRLITTYLPDLGEPVNYEGTDYPWRVRCQAHEIAKVVEQLTQEIEYDNFKNEVSDIQGAARAHRYGKVWQALYGMTDDVPEYTPSGWDGMPWPLKATSKKAAFGGVVVDPTGRVLLREVAGHYDGYVWTFAKGSPESGETPRHTALREVHEETGVRACILRPLAPSFVGGTTITYHFLMVADPERVNLAFSSSETAGLQWVSFEEAHAFIALSTNRIGRDRDLEILRAAAEALPPTPLRRPIARREDWKFKPMPAQRARLPYQREFTPSEMKQVLRGFLPTYQEQKWCIVFQNSTLHVHRSWTGIEVFRLVLEPAPKGRDHWRVCQAELNMLSSQCKYRDENEALDVLRDVVDGWLLSYGEDPGKDPMVVPFGSALGPKYLGAPPVVGQLVGDYLTVVAKMVLHREATYKEVMEAADRFTAAFVEDAAYTRMPWHSREQLGELLIRRMGLDAGYCSGESLAFVVSESAASISISVRQIFDSYCRDATQRPEALLDLLGQLKSFVVDVLLGSIVLTDPKRMLGDFAWPSEYPAKLDAQPHSDVEMPEDESIDQIVVEVRAEGGCIRLKGRQLDSVWWFRIVTDGKGLLDEADQNVATPPNPFSWIKTWRGALSALDQYQWQNLHPLTIHPAFKTKILNALKRRLPAANTDRWAPWQAVLTTMDGQ
jgi:8-oxo-dGTP pyrophosphatase MutT (NUDIX family)